MSSGKGAGSTLAATAIAAAILVVSIAAQTVEDQAKLSKLGPDGFFALPPLTVLVEWSDAAIVGRIVAVDGLTLREVDNAHSTKKSVVGYAGYRLGIDEVLFTRNPTNTESLIPDSDLDVGMEVGRDSAQKFVRRQLPVSLGDTCLVFLSARPHGWSILQWHTQFRRTTGPTPTAQNLGGDRFAAIAGSREWRGSSVIAAEAPRAPAPEWGSLIAEVRRLGALPTAHPK
jgi:hypothetical protein